jgi:hypothetical protein
VGLGDGSERGFHDAKQVKPGLTLVSTKQPLPGRAAAAHAADAGLAR